MDDQHTGLAGEFHVAMTDVYRRAKQEAGYNATRFIQMVAEQGGLTAAKSLMAAPNPSDGFAVLMAGGFSHLTVEALIVSERFRPLFNDAEVRTAERRLGIDGNAGAVRRRRRL